MPWKACKPMDERLKFVARLLDGEKMAGLCREFGISRKTGYKILKRHNDSGLEALTDRSRRPYRHAIACSRGRAQSVALFRDRWDRSQVQRPMVNCAASI